MNRLIVDTVPFLITETYKAGAVARRMEQERHLNPHPFSDILHDQWNKGFDNEAARLHVCDNTDLVGLPTTGTRSYSINRPPMPSNTPKKDALKYAHAIMVASGMLSDARDIRARQGLPMPGALATKLRERGHVLTVAFAKDLIRRLHLEDEMAGGPLSKTELQKIETLTPRRQQFLLTIGTLQETYFTRLLPVPTISRHFGKSDYWALSMARIFQRDGLGFLLTGSLQVCRPSAKGWSAIRILQSRKTTNDIEVSPVNLAA